MAYIEVEQFVPGIYKFEGPFKNGQIIKGKIRKQPLNIEVLDQDTVTVNNVICDREQGAVIFDPEGGIMGGNRVLVYVATRDAQRLTILESLARSPFSGSIQEEMSNSLTAFYKKAYTQVGVDLPEQTLASTIRSLPRLAVNYGLAILLG